MKVKVGCCGFPVAQEKYYHAFSFVELQSTFYKLPRESTLRRWREAAPPGFEFAVKAWQIITHPPSSPTWRRAGLTVEKAKGALYGYLRPTAENSEAFNRTLDVCSILGARVCLIQCPPSFQPTRENTRNVSKPQLIRKLCDRLGIVHVVDLPRRDPASSPRFVYSRLHGLGKRDVNYVYRYTDRDLQQLAQKLSSLEEIGCEEAYVFFNNISMFEDAKRFSKLVSGN
jgi:uncharacterized protein YecE (DUF72 family)